MTRRDEVEIKIRSEIALMREAGLVVARTLEKLRPGRPSRHHHEDLDELAESSIRGEGAVSLSYGGLPGPAGLPGQHLRLGQRGGRPRHPRSAGSCARAT